MARAASSFPHPLSPSINTLNGALAARTMARRTSSIARLTPTNQRLRTNLGFALAASGDFRRAAKEFEMGGTPAEAKNNLGFAYEQKGDLKNAFELYAEAARLDPASRTRARSNLAHAAAALGKELPTDLTAAKVEEAGTITSPEKQDVKP